MKTVLLAVAGLTAFVPPLAAQGGAALPDLSAARSVRVRDAWSGLSPLSPVVADYTLERDERGDADGRAVLRIGAGPLRRDTVVTSTLPREILDPLLLTLSRVRLDTGSYRPTFTHTDDSPEITIGVTVGSREVEFYSVSQGSAHVPWRVRVDGRSYVTDDPAIWRDLTRVLDRIGRAELDRLTRVVRSDPESECAFMYDEKDSAPRAPVAAGTRWFDTDERVVLAGRSFEKYGQPRMLGRNEVKARTTYRGVLVFAEAGSKDPAPDVIYIPATASCIYQPYQISAR